LLPGITKRYAIKHSKELVGRQIEMDKLKLNYFTGMIKIIDFKMFEENEKEVFISFDTLIVNLEPYQFFSSEFVMEDFYLKGLKANIIQYDSTFNFDDLVVFYIQKTDTLETKNEDDEPFHFSLSNIKLKDALFVFDDKTVDKITSIDDFSFFIPYIGWNQKDKSEAGLRFALKDEGYFESTINVDPINGDYKADIKIYHLYLESFTEYVANSININSVDGLFNSEISINGNIYEAEKSRLEGTSEVLGFSMEDGRNKKFMAAEKLSFVLNDINVFNNSYVFDSVIITKPYVYFEMDTISNNLNRIFNVVYGYDSAGTNAVDGSEGSPNRDLYYAIGHIAIKNGIVDYTDNITGKPFEYHLNKIEMEADSILSTSEWVNVYSQMLLNNRGDLKAEVGFNPRKPKDIILDYVITDFQLSDLNIYSRYYMGFPIMYGDMYYKSHTEIINSQLKSENKLIINNAELGDKKGGIYDLPVKFALFLLKDRHGVIDLDVPVRGNLDDPSVSVGKIIWKTFKNLIVKVATAPFDFLARSISADPKDLKAIEYDYLDTLFTADRQRQLDLLLELEQKKEGLEIELVYFNDREIEKQRIAVAEAGKLFAAKKGKDYRKDEEAFIRFLKSKTKMDSESIDIVKASEILIPSSTIYPLLVQFENSRKHNIEDYLSSVNDSTTIKVFLPDLKSPKNVGVKPIFEVKYTMKEKSQEKGKYPE
jgi:hypothetical protein